MRCAFAHASECRLTDEKLRERIEVVKRFAGLQLMQRVECNGNGDEGLVVRVERVLQRQLRPASAAATGGAVVVNDLDWAHLDSVLQGRLEQSKALLTDLTEQMAEMAQQNHEEHEETRRQLRDLLAHGLQLQHVGLAPLGHAQDVPDVAQGRVAPGAQPPRAGALSGTCVSCELLTRVVHCFCRRGLIQS